MSPNPAVLTWPRAVALGVYFADDFNRADGALGAGWTIYQGGGFTISNGRAVTSSSSSQASASRVAAGLPNGDHYVQAVIVEGGTAVVHAVFARASSVGLGHYLFYYYSGAFTLSRTADGATYATISSQTAAAPTNPYTLRLEVEGSNLRGYANGSLVVSGTDATYDNTRKYAGIRKGGTGTMFADDVEMGAL